MNEMEENHMKSKRSSFTSRSFISGHFNCLGALGLHVAYSLPKRSDDLQD